MTPTGGQWPVLAQLYSHVSTLSDYLDALIPSKPHEWHSESDSETFRHLLNTTVVATTAEPDALPKMSYSQPLCSQSEIMDRAHGRIFEKAHSKPSNVLALGYRMGSHRDEVGKPQPGRQGISNYAPNSMVEALKSHDWTTLLQRIGEGPMFHLLTCTSVFLDVGNGNLCQATGRPVHELVPKHEKGIKRPLPSDVAQGHPPTKRKRTEGNAHIRPPAQLNFPADINFARHRIFYARPSRRPNSNRLQVGLPVDHILNRIDAPRVPKSPKQEKQDEEDARLLSKYMFPRQYGLRNAFTFKNDRNSSELWTDSSRKEEIKQKGPVKTPLRLRPVLSLINRLLRRHSKTNYHALLERSCKSKVERQKSIAMSSTVILELMSETAEASLADSSAVTGVSVNGTMSDRIKLKPKFAQFICSHREVANFAIRVTSGVVPRAFWGTESNYGQIKRYISEFIQCRRNETLSLHHVIQNLKLSEFDWAFSASKEKEGSRRTESDTRKGREIIEDFLYWYFDSFLIPLLRTTFYCTESAAFQKQVLYFRQDDWRILCRPLLDKLCSETFERLPNAAPQASIKDRKLGFSHVRLLPKETGVRPIVNLGKKLSDKGKGSGTSINQILQAAFSVLTFERDRHPDLRGAGILSHNDIYAALKAFKKRHLTEAGKLPKLYFVKVDVRACFDTIEQGKLLEILKKILEEDGYTIQRYARLAPVTGKVKKVYSRTAIPEDEDPQFLPMAKKLANSLRHAVFSDQVVYNHEEKEELLALLEEHVTSNVVMIGDQFYRQRIGIPQGSILSTILCNFFYGDLEASNKFCFTRDPANILMRYVDDYLFITTELRNGRRFLSMMNQGHPEYGCFITPEKTVTNFEHEMSHPTQYRREIIWCGLAINMRNLNVLVDYSRYQACELADTLTIERGRHSGSAFKHAVLRLAKHRTHPLFNDTAFNSTFTVRLNIYENFCLLAMKMVRYVQEWLPEGERNKQFISNILRQVITLNYACLKSNGIRPLRYKPEFAIRESEVAWLGTRAFYDIFSRKRAQFQTTVQELKAELGKPKYRRLYPSKGLDRVVLRAAEHLSGVRF